MIKTESTRAVITACEQLQPPVEVLEALQRHNSRLELIWNPDPQFQGSCGRWEIYQLKSRGITSGEDVLCWQMSAPTLGSSITVSIVDWLKKYDTTNGGMKSKEELEKEWLQFCKVLFREIEPQRQQKKIDEIIYRSRDLVNSLSREKTVVSLSIPKQVGYDKKTNKKIFAVKR